MSLDAENELLIRKALSDKIELVSEAGYVIPAPIFFVDRGDFWATVAPKVTQKLIETTPIAFCLISRLKREDIADSACPENPLVYQTYNIYLFRQYSYERSDESSNPDVFLKRNLKSYQDFSKAFFDIWNSFLGIQPMVGFPDGWTVNSNGLTQDEYEAENDFCRYLPEIRGHSADVQCKVEVTIENE